MLKDFCQAFSLSEWTVLLVLVHLWNEWTEWFSRKVWDENLRRVAWKCFMEKSDSKVFWKILKVWKAFWKILKRLKCLHEKFETRIRGRVGLSCGEILAHHSWDWAKPGCSLFSELLVIVILTINIMIITIDIVIFTIKMASTPPLGPYFCLLGFECRVQCNAEYNCTYPWAECKWTVLCCNAHPSRIVHLCIG